MLKKVLFFASYFLLIAGCGSSNDCPNGVNTTHPNCAGYIAPQQNYYPTQTPVPCQPGTPNCINGYYQQPNQQYPQQTCQPGTPNCINGYYQQPNQQYPQQTCQPGTPNCINGYYQQPYHQYPQQPYYGYPQQQNPYGYQQPNPYQPR